jgi:hypothetical protein
VDTLETKMAISEIFKEIIMAYFKVGTSFKDSLSECIQCEIRTGYLQNTWKKGYQYKLLTTISFSLMMIITVEITP